MALIQALFPCAAMCQKVAEFEPSGRMFAKDCNIPDLSPLDPIYRDGLRFAAYSYLVGGSNRSRADQQLNLQMKLYCWSDCKSYGEAYEVMLRYGEEAKKIEDICFRTLHSSSIPSNPIAFATPVHVLLKGMPGRELSPSLTDGAAIAADCETPPVRTYPDNLSKEQFDQHPLGPEMGMPIEQQIATGLIIPQLVPSRDY